MKILLTCSRGWPGAITHLKNLSKVIDAEFIPFENIVLPFSNRFREKTFGRRLFYKLERQFKIIDVSGFKKYGDRIIFAGGWSPVYEAILKKLFRENIRPSVLWTSSIGQTDMSPYEINVFKRILHYLSKDKIKYLLLPKRVYESLKFIKNTKLFPHPVDLEKPKKTKDIELEGINVDIFCFLRPGKNILNQIIATELSTYNINLHINFNSPELLKYIGIFPVVHDWLKEEDYFNLISAMTLSLQVTHTESFNYAVCERMCLGVPVLATHNIYLLSEDEFLAKYLCVSAPDTPRKIAMKMDVLLADKNLQKEIRERAKERIEVVAEEHNQIIKEVTKKYLV